MKMCGWIPERCWLEAYLDWQADSSAGGKSNCLKRFYLDQAPLRRQKVIHRLFSSSSFIYTTTRGVRYPICFLVVYQLLAYIFRLLRSFVSIRNWLKCADVIPRAQALALVRRSRLKRIW